MTDPTVIDLLSDVDAYLCALHVHVARHDQIGADLTCGGCVLRDRIAAALPVLAGPAPVPPPADRAALRGRIAAAIRDAACPGDCGKTEEECAKERIQPFVWHHGRLAVVEGEPEMFADAVLAVLPPPADRTTVLREAAAAIEAEQAREEATEWAQYGELDHETEVQGGAVRHSAALLRRLAAEAQPVCAECGHPHAAHREGDDPVTPGTCGACEADDPDEAHHDFAGARQDGAQP